MRATATYDAASSPDEVAAYLANPRNLVMANHQGPVVDQSEPPTRSGSWFVFAFDQIRVRVEYKTFEPPTLIAISVTYSGLGSAGLHGTDVYRLGPIPGGSGTRVTLDTDRSGGWVPDAISRLMWRWSIKPLKRRMDAAIAGGKAPRR
jgi:hypothetical protein